MTNALTLLAEFDKYFQSCNRIPPEVRTSVPTAEWVALRDAVQAALAAPAPQPSALAMAVLQSDLYHGLDDDARAECDALLAGQAAPAPQPEIDRLNSERLDLACLVLRLIRRMRAARAGEGMAAGDDALELNARGYLQCKGLSANPLRDGGDEEIECSVAKDPKTA